MEDLLREAVARRASDLHMTAGVPPMLRIHGQLTPMSHQVLTDCDTEQLLNKIAETKKLEELRLVGEVDFAFVISGLYRFRIHAFRQSGRIAIAVRVIAAEIPGLDDFQQADVLKALARKSRGLVLVAGPTGSGKSTTLAAMIHFINQERSCHIITLEDPIEYVHRHQRSMVNQREIHADTLSFAQGLRSALREDPDVLLVGEMRDAETVATAVTAAETGHLVLATLHTGDTAQTIDRVIDVFPANQQQQIRLQLSLTLQGIVCQQLLPRADAAGRIAAMELLVATPAIRNLIREGKSHQVLSLLQTGAGYGMQSMDMALRNLYCQGLIAYPEALSKAADPETFSLLTRHSD